MARSISQGLNRVRCSLYSLCCCSPSPTNTSASQLYMHLDGGMGRQPASHICHNHGNEYPANFNVPVLYPEESVPPRQSIIVLHHSRETHSQIETRHIIGRTISVPRVRNKLLTTPIHSPMRRPQHIQSRFPQYTLLIMTTT